MINVSIFCVYFPPYTTSRDERSPTEFFFFTPPRGTERNLPTYRSIGPRPIFHFPFTPPRGTEQKSPTYCPIGLRPIFLSYTTSWYILFLFFLSYTTSWHRAEIPDILLKRSPTDLFLFFLHHLVAHFFLTTS